MRRHNRFYTDVSIKRLLANSVFIDNEKLQDISIGGLCFNSSQYIEPGAVITIEISIFNPVFKVQARVVWCNASGMKFNTGVQFTRIENGSIIRTVEYLQFLDQYRRNLSSNEGRRISCDEAYTELVHRGMEQNIVN
jgi:hypothetical protein